MQLWLHSDWHWQHDNIYKFTYLDSEGVERRMRERFADAREGDDYIAQRIADLVKPSDHVWFLGDMTMHRGNNASLAFIKLMKSLPGHKRLILGNHDHYHVSVYVEAGFEKVRASNQLEGILMTHYPVHPSSIGFKVKANAHGHIHQNNSPAGKYLNMCVEQTNYEPVPFEDVKTAADKLNVVLEEAKRAALYAKVVTDVSGAVMEGP